MMYKTGANRVRDRTKKWLTITIYFDEEGIEIDKRKIKEYIKTGYTKHIYEYGSYNYQEYWYKCERSKQIRLL